MSSVQRHRPGPTSVFFKEEAIGGLVQGDAGGDSLRASAGPRVSANRSNRMYTAAMPRPLQGQPAGAVRPHRQTPRQTHLSRLSPPHTTPQPDSRSGQRLDVCDKHTRISPGRPVPTRAQARAPRGTL
jgi:hypothetical protein